MKKLLLVLFITSIFLSCDSEDGVISESKLVSLNEIKGDIGFSGFDAEMDKYKPIPAIIDEIKAEYDESTTSFLMFVKPSCSCQGNHELIPKMIKILNEANIGEDKMKIYSMISSSSTHPFEKEVTLSKLPAFFIVKSDTYSEVLAKYGSKDTSNTNTLESFLLDGLKEN